MSDSSLSFDSVTQAIDVLIQARHEVKDHLHELLSSLQLDRLLSEELVNKSTKMIFTALQLQEECCALLPKTSPIPSTISELKELGEEQERASQIAVRVEQAKEAILLFTQLHCLHEEIVDEFKEKQEKAEQLLEKQLSDEELLQVAESYQLLVTLVLRPDEPNDSSGLYEKIRKEFGFGVKHALVNNCLVFPHTESEDEVAVTIATLEPLEEHELNLDESTVVVEDIVEELQLEEKEQEAAAIIAESADDSVKQGTELVVSLDPLGNCIDFSQLKQITSDKGKRKDSFSANKFEGELFKVSRNLHVPTYVMEYVYYHGVLAASQLLEVTATLSRRANTSADLLHTVLKQLCNKGYLMEYDIKLGQDHDSYFVLSEYGAVAFRKETSRKLIQSRSQLRGITRRANDDVVQLGSIDPGSGAYRLRSLNRAHYKLGQELQNELMLVKTDVSPFVHRVLRHNRTDKSFLLLPGVLDATTTQDDLARVNETVKGHPDLIPIIVVNSIESGRHWVERVSTADQPAYFLLFDEQTLVVGDGEGLNCFDPLFEMEEEPAVEEESEPILEETSLDDSQDVNEPAVKEGGQTSSAQDAVTDVTETVTHMDDPVTSIGSDDLEHVVKTALNKLAVGRQAEGMLLLHSVASYSEDVRVLRDKVSLILDDPLGSHEDWRSLVDLPVSFEFYDSEALDDYLNAALWLRVFFGPDNPNDYILTTRWQQIKSDRSNRVLAQYPGIKELIRHFWDFIDRHNVGVKYCVSEDVRDQLDIKYSLEKCQQKIDVMLKTVFPKNAKSKFNHRKTHLLVKELFGNTGALTQILNHALTIPLQALREECQKFADLPAATYNLDMHPLQSKLEEYIDQCWEKIEIRSIEPNLIGIYRNRILGWLRDAVELLFECYACRFQAQVRKGEKDIPHEVVRKTRQKALELMKSALAELNESTSVMDVAGKHCLQAVICQFQEMLGDQIADTPQFFYESLLSSGEIELDGNYLPIFDEQWLQDTPPVVEYSMWKRVLRHCEQDLPSWEDAAENALRNYDMGIYDLIIKRFGDQGKEEGKVNDIRKKATQDIRKHKEDFMTAVESAQNYGQMASNDEMYGYFRLAEAAEKHVNDTHNVGFFKRLLDTCLEQIKNGSDARMEDLRSRLEVLKSEILQDPEREDGESDDDVLQKWPILEKINRMLDNRNMTVAEDYIQLAREREKDTPSILKDNRDAYSLFIENYQKFYAACNAHKSEDFYRAYDRTGRSMLFQNQNNRNTASADKFISAWSKNQASQLKEFMEQLIFHEVEEVERRGDRDNQFYVYPRKQDAKLAQNSHPFEAFGTRAVDYGVRVLRMAGTRKPDSLLDEVASQGAGEGSATIVLLDYAMSLAERRVLAKSIKLRSTPEIIVVIDRVMALFLAGYDKIERRKAFLMVALPFSKAQPYIPEGSIPSEMFIGRTEELDKIQSLNGPVFVYGGRQLGKTALLRESKNREHDPENGRYAIFVDLKTMGIQQSLRRISEELVSEGVLAKRCATWDDLRAALRLRLSNRGQPIRKLILMLDEADAFITDCEIHKDLPLEMLRELKDSFSGQFKFVLAGLRDIVRFNKKRLGGNSVLAHLGHITIRPLKYRDARELLLRPLQYLGFRISEKGEDIISLILAKTNYYPGLIHFYCQKLIEAIRESYQNGTYSDQTAPPYLLDEKHIKTLLGNNEFLNKIEEKFRITLQLETDNQYDILATAMAYHYYEQGVGRGATVQDIIQICKDFEINKITSLSVESVKALLEEMDELNIFRQESRGNGSYVFNRYSFFQMLGNQNQVLDHLFENSGQGEV